MQDQLAVAQGDIALNLINVYRAIGGGWEIRSHENCFSPAVDTCEQTTCNVAPFGPPAIEMTPE